MIAGRARPVVGAAARARRRADGDSATPLRRARAAGGRCPVLVIAPRARFVHSNAPTGPGRQRPSVRGADGETARVAEFGGDRQRREIVHPAETPQRSTRARSGSSVTSGPQVRFHGPEPSDRFIDGAQISLDASGRAPAAATPAPAARCRAASTTPSWSPVKRRRAQQKFREAMPRAQQIRADVFATAQQIARRFFLLGRNVDRRQRARPDTASRAGPHRADPS